MAGLAPFDHDTRMSAPPQLSVVVPTCGRPESLRRLLDALATQVHPPRFEVVVVGDGVPAPALQAALAGDWPFTVVPVAQESAGPAVARNRGAQEARGNILLFIDDDVVPGEKALAAHADFHATHLSTIGAGDLAPAPAAGGFIGAALCGWWEAMCDRLHDPRHRFTFRDLLTGHCSMPRQLFEELGRFDESLRCHEDFEFGYRAIEAGVDLRFVPGADGQHRDGTDLRKILARKFDEGIAHIQLVARHPALLRALPLGRPNVATGFQARVYESALTASRTGEQLARSLVASMAVFERLAMRDKWREALERAMDYWYWRGVVAGAGSAEAVRSVRARVDPPEAEPQHVDLAQGLERAERLIDSERPRSIRVTMGPDPICVLDERPGSERLRGVHLRPLLLKGYPVEFAAAAARAGMLPAVFLDSLAQRHVGPPIAPAAGQARVA